MRRIVQIGLVLIGCMVVLTAPNDFSSFYLNLANVQFTRVLMDDLGDFGSTRFEHISGNHWDELLRLFERALYWGRRGNGGSRADVQMAKFLLLTGRWEAAGKLMAATDQQVDPALLRQGLPQSYAVQAMIEAQKLNPDAVESNCIFALAAASGQWANRLPDIMTESLAQFCTQQGEGEQMPRVHYWLGELLRSRGKLYAAAVEYGAALGSASFRTQYPEQAGKASYFIAREAEESGSWEQAIGLYEQAIAEDLRLFDAYERLASLYRQREDWSIRIEELNERLSQMQPEFIVNQQLDSWVFVGYDLHDEEAVGLGGRFFLTLYWRPIVDEFFAVPPVSAGWYRSGVVWIEVRESVNLLRNSGFEWDPLGMGYPFGYGGLYGWESDRSHRVVVTNRLDRLTKAGALANDLHCDTSSLTSEKVEVRLGRTYLLTGWVKGEPGANAGLGYLCFRENGEFVMEEYAVRGVGGTYPAQVWNRFSKVIQVPEDVYSCQVVANNYQSLSGTAYFDNLVFVEVGYPAGTSGRDVVPMPPGQGK